MKYKILAIALVLLFVGCFYNCSWDKEFSGTWDVEMEGKYGTMELAKKGYTYTGELSLIRMGNALMENMIVEGNKLSANVDILGEEQPMFGVFEGGKFTGYILAKDRKIPLVASRQENKYMPTEQRSVKYTLVDSDLGKDEKDLDHAGLIRDFDAEGFERGQQIYTATCVNCHGTPEMEGSIPMSTKFWEQPFKYGNDPFAMYNTITKGSGSMPAQLTLSPQEKYDVIAYIRENFVRPNNKDSYYRVSSEYLAQLPEGTNKGQVAKPYNPWCDMDYGNFFINTYELVDAETGTERFHSEGPPPYPDENYLKNNFAYKGIAVRLDEGPGGVSEGNAWMVFDHDLMRVAGGWTGKGFIDWDGILLNDKHETYPRTIGKLHFETPVAPAWANPENGSFQDPRFTARDGRKFGPLPTKWTRYKGIYQNGSNIIISYGVGNANILERLGMENMNDKTVFTRTLNISPSATALKLRVAPEGTKVAVKGAGAKLKNSDGFVVLEVAKGKSVALKLLIANSGMLGLDEFAEQTPAPESLEKYTKGGALRYPQELTTVIVKGDDKGPIAVDELTPPFDNPWRSRMKLSGIDFLKDGNSAVACTTDGDIWSITGLTDDSGKLTWKRIASGLFQPLGIKVVQDKVYVICRDQLVRLQDLNGNGETDFYENFNSDHQVTDHFHEFAMGLQADDAGNFYYAKSGRHAREALVPQHGTLLKVSKDGSHTDIIAKGFRAANGVCINPDGSFIVTDQQGNWNPTNRVNWVEGDNKFYGNMWGYDPPKDSTRTAMEKPMVWIDMEFDRSPSELLWVDSKKWGPLAGGLLSFSYGFGKVQLVLPQKVDGQRQAGVVDLPGVDFPTGIMRGRFNPDDGQLYVCGMSAWGTSQMMQGGGLYRLRYTDKPLSVPVQLSAQEDGILLTFASELNLASAEDIKNFEIQTWHLVRSSRYGSERYNTKTLEIGNVVVSKDGKSIKILLPEIQPVDVMTISYKLKDTKGNHFTGKVQNTIHNLEKIDQANGIENASR